MSRHHRLPSRGPLARRIIALGLIVATPAVSFGCGDDDADDGEVEFSPSTSTTTSTPLPERLTTTSVETGAPQPT